MNITELYIQLVDWEASKEDARDHFIAQAATMTDLKEAWFERYMQVIDCPREFWPFIDRKLVDGERERYCHPPIQHRGQWYLFRAPY